MTPMPAAPPNLQPLAARLAGELLIGSSGVGKTHLAIALGLAGYGQGVER